MGSRGYEPSEHSGKAGSRHCSRIRRERGCEIEGDVNGKTSAEIEVVMVLGLMFSGGV